MKSRILLYMVAMLAIVSCSKKQVLFNGNDLEGWVPVASEETVFSVQDGCINVTGNPFGYLRTAQVFGDYKLHAEWRWVGEPTNSGIFQRIQLDDKIWPDAIECQLHVGDAGDFVCLGGARVEEVPAGPEVEFPVKERNSKGNIEKPAGEWNTADIICVGKKITVYINGQLENECTCKNEKGYIALQSEGGPVQFQNIYIEEIEK